MRCKKLETLERAVNDAASGVHERRGVARTVARIEERAAVKALDLHIKQHGCKGFPMMDTGGMEPEAIFITPSPDEG